MSENPHHSIRLTVPLRLRFGAAEPRQPAAWFISGGPADWLNEIGRWNVPLTAVSLLMMPAGVLALVEGDTAPAATARAQPYVCLAGRLYIPAESRLHPPVSDDEIARVFGRDIGALHPVLGLIRRPHDPSVTALSLFQVGTAAPADWSRAVTGVYAEPRIRSVEPLEPPGMDAVMQALRDDISSDTPDELPPLPDEQTTRRIIDQTKAKVLGFLAKGLPGSNDPTTAKGPLAKLGAWMAGKAAELQQDLAAARHKELARLMKLLERNPDAGLRFALPLTATNSGRGAAPPGAHLSRRNPNFSLQNLGRGGPSDTWDTSDDMRKYLTAKYRELANRELSLGRQRRAAYIFAELLGDFDSAANALMQGHFWREAAALYRDKLKQVRTAAECLEKGGLLIEAIAVYDELNDYEKVGSLFTLMQRPEEAEAAFRQAVNAALRVPDYLAGARLLEQNIGKPDEALATLESGWPLSDQAFGCLQAAFGLMGRHGWHDQAMQRLAAMRPLQRDEHAAPIAAGVLAGVARDYPTGEVRVAAADLTRVIAGTRLSTSAGYRETRQLLEAVQRVAIDDRLLMRDINRFQSQRPPGKPPAPVATPPALARRAAGALAAPKVVKEFHLPHRVRWLQASALRQSFVALGVTQRHVVVARVTYDGQSQLTQFDQPDAEELSLTLSANRDEIYIAPLIRELTDQRYSPRVLPAAHDLAAATVGWPSHLPQGLLLGVAQTDGMIWTISAPPTVGLLVSTYHRAGKLVHTREIEPTFELGPTFLAASERYAWLCTGSAIYPLHHGGRFDQPVQLHSPVVGIDTSPPNTLFRMVIRHPEGVTIVWPLHEQTLSFARDLVDPATCLGRDGLLVVIGKNGGRAARLEGHDITTPVSFPSRKTPPVALLTTPYPDTLAAVHSDGLVEYLSYAR